MDFTYNFPAVKGMQAKKEYYIAMVPLGIILNIITAALTIHMPTKQHPEDAVRSENSPWGI